MLSWAKSATARPGDRLNGFKNGKTQLFNSRGIVKWAYFQKKWSVHLRLLDLIFLVFFVCCQIICGHILPFLQWMIYRGEHHKKSNVSRQPTNHPHLCPILSLCFFRAFSAISCEANCTKASPVLLPWKSTGNVIPFGTISNPSTQGQITPVGDKLSHKPINKTLYYSMGFSLCQIRNGTT